MSNPSAASAAPQVSAPSSRTNPLTVPDTMGRSAYQRAFDGFENPTDGMTTSAGILEFVSTTLRAHGWAYDGDSSASAVLCDIEGAEAVRRFRFLACLVDLAIELSKGGDQ